MIIVPVYPSDIPRLETVENFEENVLKIFFKESGFAPENESPLLAMHFDGMELSALQAVGITDSSLRTLYFNGLYDEDNDGQIPDEDEDFDSVIIFEFNFKIILPSYSPA